MNDELTTRLSRQLHAEADDWQGAPLTLEGVQGTARTIRHRRRVAAGSALAVAVLAIAIPIGVTFGGAPDTSPPPANPSPTRLVDTENPVPESPLGVPFLAGTTLTLPNGAEETLPQAYDGGTVLGTTVMGLRNDNGSLFLDVLGEDLQVEETVPLDTGFAPNVEGSAIAYVTRGELVVRSESGVTSFGEVPAGSAPVRLVGGPDCAEQVATCVVYLNDQAEGAPRVMTNVGAVNDVAGNPVSVTDAAEDGRIALVTSVDLSAGGACSAVVASNGGAPLFETCDHTAGRFAPGGAHLSAEPAYQSGIGDTYAAILDAESGDEVARFEPGRGGFVRDSTWEDAEHLLVTTYSYDEGWSVVRLGVDGSREVALGPDDSGDDMTPSLIVLGGS